MIIINYQLSIIKFRILVSLYLFIKELMGNSLRKLLLAVILLILSLFAGTIGFYIIEDFDVLNAFYMSVITLSTVGFAEVHEMSDS